MDPVNRRSSANDSDLGAAMPSDEPRKLTFGIIDLIILMTTFAAAAFIFRIPNNSIAPSPTTEVSIWVQMIFAIKYCGFSACLYAAVLLVHGWIKDRRWFVDPADSLATIMGINGLGIAIWSMAAGALTSLTTNIESIDFFIQVSILSGLVGSLLILMVAWYAVIKLKLDLGWKILYGLFVLLVLFEMINVASLIWMRNSGPQSLNSDWMFAISVVHSSSIALLCLVTVFNLVRESSQSKRRLQRPLLLYVASLGFLLQYLVADLLTMLAANYLPPADFARIRFF